MQNRVFFPHAAVDQWSIDGHVNLVGSELVVLADGRRYEVVEAVHIVTEVTGANDAEKVVGKVKPKTTLEELGAELLESSMILGDNAYDVVPGWLGTATTPFAEHAASAARTNARATTARAQSAPPHSDEELLKQLEDGNP